MCGPDAFSIMAQATHSARVQEEQEWRLSRRPAIDGGQVMTTPATEAPATHATWVARVRGVLGKVTDRYASAAIRSRLV